MKITEPVTMLTDYFLAGFSLVLSLKLLRLAHTQGRLPVSLWGWGFFAMAAAAALGGTFHGFALVLENSTRTTLWNATVYAIGLGTSFMISGAMTGSIPRQSEAAHWLISGLVLSVLGLAVQQSSLGLGQHFNHNDIYHCIQTAALYLFYRGARLC